eukprot:COSAG05_NODE_1411_length_4958_cov_2.723400_6_plen_81_part_00
MCAPLVTECMHASRWPVPTSGHRRPLARWVAPTRSGEFQRPWKRCSIIAKWRLEFEIAMWTRTIIPFEKLHIAHFLELPS